MLPNSTEFVSQELTDVLIHGADDYWLINCSKDVYKRQVYDSDAYPEEVRHDYVALERVTTRFRTELDYLLRTMADTAQREVILEIIDKHKVYLDSLESALAEDE